MAPMNTHHRAHHATSVKLGQVGVKLSFHVSDVAAFATQAKLRGLVFGTVHEANGYAFANAKDLDKNSISISSRAHRVSGLDGNWRPGAFLRELP